MSGDVNPQWLSIALLAPANDNDTWDTFTVARTNIPIQRLPTRGAAQVMEILRIQYIFYGPSTGVVESTLKENNLLIVLGTDGFDASLTGGTLDRSDGDIIDMQFESYLTKDPGGTHVFPITGTVDGTMPLEAELTIDTSLFTSPITQCQFLT